MSANLSTLVAGLALVAIIYGGLSDLTRFKIPNTVSYGLVGLFAIYAALNWFFPALQWRHFPLQDHLVIGLTVFVIFLVFWKLRWVGGGDVKFVAATSLWMGPTDILKYVILLSAISVLLMIAVKFLRQWATYIEASSYPQLIKNLTAKAQANVLPYGFSASIAAVITLVPSLMMQSAVLPKV